MPDRTAALGVTIARAFNHLGPRQDPQFVASGFARRIADIERGRWEPEISVGNLDARRDLTDVRDTVRAYTLILERGTPGPALQRVLRPRDHDPPAARSAARARARAGVTSRSIRRATARTTRRCSLGDPSRLRDELGWTARDSARADARRSARILAQSNVMKVLVTGGTGYLGRAVVRALAARGHELVVFARTAGAQRASRHARSTATSAIAMRSNAPPPAATPSRTPPRSSASGAAGAPTSTTSTSAGCATCWRSHARVRFRASCTPRRSSRSRRAATTAPIEANDYQRTKVAADRVADEAVRDGAPLIRVYPGVVYGPGTFTEGNLVGRLIARSPRAQAAGPRRP